MHTQTHARTPWLKQDWVIRVTFGPDQAGLIQFVKYLSLTRILHRDQRDELSVLHGDHGSISPQKFQSWSLLTNMF